MVDEPALDPELTSEQEKRTSLLSAPELEEIDRALLTNAKLHWRKVAMLVGVTMQQLPNRLSGIPDVFYSQRVRALVEDGKLESKGDLNSMKWSEVQISSDTD